MTATLLFVLQLEQNLEALLIQHGPLAYLILGGLIFCGIGVLPLVFLPADMLLFLSGALAAVGVLDPLVLAPTLVVAALAGTVFNYGVARAIANVWQPKEQSWIYRASARTRGLYARHGASLLLYSPFIAIVRAVAPAMAGATRMQFPRFFRFALGGALIWVAVLVGPGYYFGHIPWVRSHLHIALAIVIGVGVAALLINALWKVRRKRRARAEAAKAEHPQRSSL
ncbi:VTT domain-containing protein [Pandoraea pnomenusa]|uniref:DedA family protein n=1 Tax=Pandoraea pnomenusa TaxID=93220 RepID=UPI00334011B6